MEGINMPKGDKYKNLGKFLSESGVERIKLSFKDIEKIIGDSLPESATRYAEAWWSNHYGHSQAISWMDAGYDTDYVTDTYKSKAIIFVKR